MRAASAVVVVEARGVRRNLLAPLLRAGDALRPGSRPWRWVIVVAPARTEARCAAADLRVLAARLERALLHALGECAAPAVGWLELSGEVAPPPALLEEEALRRGRLERERRALFRAVGHELRTPLTSVRGYLELLLADPPQRRAEARRFLEIAQRETLRATRLVDGLFELSLLEAGAAPLRLGRGSLAAIAHAALESLALEARRRDVVLRRELRQACAVLDEERVAQAVLNVVHNAIKYARSGVWVRTRTGRGAVLLVVDDDGPGFDAEELRTGPVYGRRGSAGRGIAGSGVGLALAGAVAALHGGGMALSTSPHGGARVRLRIPAG
ncbi:HAMP domain-containing histidine kinase [bacterium]|nr:MAG: HAMP domain-containing histidine kinase [bacterium]